MRRILILATVIVLVMGAGIAIAQVGDDGVIHACARNWTGALRLVDDPDECRRWEVPVSWNEQGVPGLDGAAGLDGSPGLDGNLALANQVCEAEGASVIGFDAGGDIICHVGGATTTTTTATPPDLFDLTGGWIVTVSRDDHSCVQAAPEVGYTITVDDDNTLRASWTTNAGDWYFEAEGVPPVFEADEVGEAGTVFAPDGQFIEAELGAYRTATMDWLYIVTADFMWDGDETCGGIIDVTAKR